MKILLLNGLKLLAVFAFCTALPTSSLPKDFPLDLQEKISSDQSDLKQVAFEILDNKCNHCHLKQNPRRVFTPYNMESFASNIYQQVVVKKRMPKGRKTKLTAEEYNSLEAWLITQISKNN